MNEDEKKTDETEATPEGAVEVKEEDLDKASGGAAYVKMPVDETLTQPSLTPELKDPSLNYTPGGDTTEKVSMQDFHNKP